MDSSDTDDDDAYEDIETDRDEPCPSNGDIFPSEQPAIDSDAQHQENASCHVDPESHKSLRFYSFPRAAHHLMVECLSFSRYPSHDEIKVVDPSIVGRNKNKNRSPRLYDERAAVEYRWKEMQDKLFVQRGENGVDYLYHKSTPTVRIPHRDQWREIFDLFHVDAKNHHLGWYPTQKRIKEQWSTNIRRFGIPDIYIRDCVSACPTCYLPRSGSGKPQFMPNSPKRRRRQEFHFTERMTAIARELPSTLEEIAVKYKVLLRVERVSTMSRPMLCEVKDYVCHRGKSRRHQAGLRDNAKVRDRKSCRIGCPFRIRLVVPVSRIDGVNVVQEEGMVNVLLYPYHVGHQPGSHADLLRLPPHPSVIRYCEQDLNDVVGDIQAVARATVRRASLLYSQATEGDQASFRFYLSPKDVERLAYRLRSRDALSEEDWAALHLEAQALQGQGKVIFYQQYSPNHADEDKRPFVLVLQDAWMRDIAKRFSIGSAWVIGSIFKTIQFGLPLFGGILPNQMGGELPIWFMLCSVDVGTQHESIALKLTLQEVFKWLGHVRPSAIVVDKSLNELHAIQAVIEKDPFCWRDNILGGEQVACRVLLCWFHVKRDWLENLLPEVPVECRKDVYQSLNDMMMSVSERKFTSLLHDFYERYSDQPSICKYVNFSWAGSECIWRKMWPRHCRLFEHKEVETTIFAERLWQYIKYNLLRGRSNRNVRDLVAALIGRSDGERLQRDTLVEYYKQKQASGRYCMQGWSKLPRRRSLSGMNIFQMYETDPSVVETIDEVGLKFRIRSEIIPDLWHNICLQSHICDCLEVVPCKHLLGLRMIVEQCFTHLCPVLPPMEAMPRTDEISHIPEDISEARAVIVHSESMLDFHIPNVDPMDVCADENVLRGLYMKCVEMKAELDRLSAMVAGLTRTEAAAVLQNVLTLKRKLQSFGVLEKSKKKLLSTKKPF
ncbi:hypothetical protein O6H91_04G094800 [Diphasiastrum complanatum]|uniref:Uncharacterized protein n=1 Tax=Diphasiastrum complanatum TaxID=34168 RepID=A0ACC2DZN3_DIPCM|nr:hypothetical protein O6H91_04G094800 [Diphasiastrum complanatum]